jgi:peptidyl-prolyl cis-trans isomerase A (cyclophilin A)
MNNFGINIIKIYRETKYATLKTTKGKIVIKLFSDHAPKTVANFVKLATGKREWTDPETKMKTTRRLYDGTIFHRVIPNFMIQGGDPLGNGYGGPGFDFDDEIHPDLIFNKPYLVAMANSGPNTNGSQFFITVAPTPWLNQKYTIFGEVEDRKSKKVVDTIVNVKTGENDRPIDPIKIESVSVSFRSKR